MSATTDVTDPAASVAQTSAKNTRRGLDLGRFRELSLVPAILVLGLIGFIVSPAFLTSDNLIGVAQQSTELSLLVLATALILIVGRMDLSLESTIGVAPVIAVWLVLPTSGGRFNGLGLFPQWTAIPLCLLVGVAIGAFNGFLILKLRLNGFIVTLGGLTMLRGLQVALSEGQSIVDLPPPSPIWARPPGWGSRPPSGSARCCSRRAAARWRGCATAGRCTRSAATRRPPGPPVSGSTGSCGSC